MTKSGFDLDEIERLISHGGAGVVVIDRDDLAAIAAMAVQAKPVAELRAEITRLTEALRSAEERADTRHAAGYQAAIADVVEWLRAQQHGRTSDNYPAYYANEITRRFGKGQ